MSELRVGGLAVLISSDDENLVGSVVELIDYLGCDSYLSYGAAYLWNLPGNRMWWVKLCSGQTFFSSVRGFVSDGFCGERRLMPLDGDPDSVVNSEKELAIS